MVRFITIIVLGFSVFHSSLAGQSEKKLPLHFVLQKLTEGVFACTHVFGGEGTCNAGVIDMGKYTVVIDPFLSPVAAEELHQWILGNELPPVKFVINTHYHNDHVRGNQIFSKDVRIIATGKTATLIRAEEPKSIAAESQYAPALCHRFTKKYTPKRAV
jgi:glyoxylase-like metal-dependent hydrolase (beta-lactamase superfamily II)